MGADYMRTEKSEQSSAKTNLHNCGPLPWILCKISFLLSFRGAAGDEESRSAMKMLRARFLASLGMTVQRRFSHRHPWVEGVRRRRFLQPSPDG